MYAVCKNGRCAQTYHVDNVVKGRSREVFLSDIKITKGFRCEKCGCVVVDVDGTALLSRNPTVITYISIEDLENDKKRRLKEAKRKLKEAKKELKLLEEEYKEL